LGRADDMINTGGYKVAPAKVEDAAMAVAAVADCLCVAGHHPVLGTVPKLLVVTREGQALDRKTLAQALALQLEPHEVPVQYEQVDAIKRTFNGKPDRKAYR
jgi:long-chain acyl-CoA synthetase